MISDWYQAILDVKTPVNQAKPVAIDVTSKLASEGIITLHAKTLYRTHTSGKFAPGPKFSTASGGTYPLPYHAIGGMDVHTSPWINEYGIVGLEYAHCPICGSEFTTDNMDKLSTLRTSFSKAGDYFLKKQLMPTIPCPSCQADVSAIDWITHPHAGFCNLVFTFWNWPPFESWSVDIPKLIGKIIGHKVVVTYGKL